jgi:hypothetical protein
VALQWCGEHRTGLWAASNATGCCVAGCQCKCKSASICCAAQNLQHPQNWAHLNGPASHSARCPLSLTEAWLGQRACHNSNIFHVTGPAMALTRGAETCNTWLIPHHHCANACTSYPQTHRRTCVCKVVAHSRDSEQQAIPGSASTHAAYTKLAALRSAASDH